MSSKNQAHDVNSASASCSSASSSRTRTASAAASGRAAWDATRSPIAASPLPRVAPYASRAAHGSLSSAPPSSSKVRCSSPASHSIAALSGARHFWFQPRSGASRHPQSDRHRSTPCTQLHELGSTSSTAWVAGCAARNAA